jgi:hypothetical protein
MIMTSSTAIISNSHLPLSGGMSSSSVGGSFWYYREFVSTEKKIETALRTAELDEGENRPSEQAIAGITRLVEIASKTTPFPSKAEISVFFGEAVTTWKSDMRQVTLISRGNGDDPKLLRYESGQSQQRSESQIVTNATPEDLRKAIRWLHF